MEKVLVTGATGYVGSHVVDTLICQKYKVIATVEQIEQADTIREHYPDEENLAFVTLPDISQDNALLRIMKFNPDIDHVIHLAAPPRTGDTDKDIDMAMKSIKNTILAIDKHGDQVKTVVVTSSFAAMINDPPKFNDPNKTYSPRDVNHITRDQAKQDSWKSYLGVKTFAETNCWRVFVDQFPPTRFSMVTIALPLIMGPPIHSFNYSSMHNSAINDPAQSMGHDDFFTNSLLKFASKSIDSKTLPADSLPIPFAVDVRDAAMAHVKALSLPIPTDRWFVASYNVCPQHIIDVARDVLKPELAQRLPARGDSRTTEDTLDAQCAFDCSDADQVSDLQHLPFNVSVKDMFEKLFSI